MTKRRIILLLLVCGLFFFLGAVLWPAFTAKPEPSYGGKTLSEWVIGYNWSLLSKGGDKAADAAIRHIGTNAIPTLLGWVQYHPPKQDLNLPVIGAYLRQSASISQHKILAPQVFGILGPQAKDAIPHLIMLMESQDELVSGKAISSLASLGNNLGPEMTPMLVEALTNKQSSIVLRCNAAVLLGQLGTNAQAAATTMLNRLQQADVKERTSIINALRQIDIEVYKHATQH